MTEKEKRKESLSSVAVVVKEAISRPLRYLYPSNWQKPRKLQNFTDDVNEVKTESDTCMVPTFEDYQLIGDSLLLRFSEQILFYRCKTDPCNGARALGLCVSGQTVEELWKRIASNRYSVSKKIILLIGTNDLLKNTRMEDMKLKFKAVVKLLAQTAERIIVLTLPPVPRLSHEPAHWDRLDIYNKFIKKQEKRKRVTVAGITEMFLKASRRCRTDYYELFYADKRRPDRVHLNRQGLQKLHDFLLQKKLLV